MKPYNMAMLNFSSAKEDIGYTNNGIFIAVNMTLPIMQSSNANDW